MSEDDVRQLLGEPDDVDAGPVTFWWYGPKLTAGSGSVDFMGEGVSGWDEP